MTRALLATRKGLFALEPGSETLRCLGFLGDPVTMALFDRRDCAVYAAVGHGHFGAKLHRSVDCFSSATPTWQECAAPVYPPKPEGLVDLDPQRGTERSWSLNMIWSLEAGGDNEPGVLWCGTIPGGLFRSEDRGASWQINDALWSMPERKRWFGGGYEEPGIHSIVVDPRDSRRIAVGISCGGVWVSEDRGATWRGRTRGMWAAYMPEERKNEAEIQDPHRVVACPAAPDQLWVQHHNGAFVSDNGARDWRELTIAPSSFGFTVAAHPRDPKTAWFVPAQKDELRIPCDGDFVVARTRDGGASFTLHRTGLPPRPAYDLVYRHALDVSRDGSVLVMGSTTGNAWLSRDEGESWSVLSHHLPPVFCVRVVD